MNKRSILCILLLASMVLAQNVKESSWDAAEPVLTNELSSADLHDGQTFGYYMWFRHSYRLPKREPLSHLVNYKTNIAGVTENTSYQGDAEGDRALGAFLLPFGANNGPVISFSSYTTSGGNNINADIKMEVDEIDGVWNWIYVGYNHVE